MKRLFFALWPAQDVRRQCHRVQRKLKGYGRPVAVDNIHITLLFLGATDDAQQDALMNAAATIAIEPRVLTFDSVSFWKKPAVCCLTSENSNPSVTAIADSLRNAAMALGMEVDQRPFKPHVTLLRKARAIPEIDIEPIIWPVSGFCLVESCSVPGGVEYRVLRQWGTESDLPPETA